MSKKPRISFREEVIARFRFLVDELGASEQAVGDRRIPCVRYDGEGFGYFVVMEERSVVVSVVLPTSENSSYVAADLHEVVNAAALAPRQSVLVSAGTSHALLRSLDSQAGWVRVVHPLVVGAGGVALLRRARG
ncbi:hypothetical protein [Umezawaea sp. NPDC059074]|uniref:hypothetical protein n=1 Tax=Umezawaea sp. NPDC059074 TaxID=3346716 RepID=UPI00369EC616